jgi:hypothetical protein
VSGLLVGAQSFRRSDLLTVTTLTGHRILFVDVCTNFVHKEVEELSGYAIGGRSWANTFSLTQQVVRMVFIHQLCMAELASCMAHM